jgi:hypothetical protein
MSRTAGMWVAAGLSVLMTAASLVVTSHRWLEPSTWAPVFWTVALSAGPFALYFGYCLRMYLEIVTPSRTLRFQAHVLSLVWGAAVLAVLVSSYGAIWGYGEDLLWDFLPRALSAAVVGSTGLAWGALWRLPRPKGCHESSDLDV